MRLFNLDGMAIFGPGSEWLWTMAQFLALLVTGLAIFRQVRAQRWANDLRLVTRLADEMLAEGMIRHKVAALIHVAQKQPAISPSMAFVAGWFDDTAESMYGGYLRRELAMRFWGDMVQHWWAVVTPMLLEARKADPTVWASFERWAADSAARDRKTGSVKDLTPAFIDRWISETIPFFIEQLRIRQELKVGTIPVWPVPESAMPEVAETEGYVAR